MISEMVSIFILFKQKQQIVLFSFWKGHIQPFPAVPTWLYTCVMRPRTWSRTSRVPEIFLSKRCVTLPNICRWTPSGGRRLTSRFTATCRSSTGSWTTWEGTLQVKTRTNHDLVRQATSTYLCDLMCMTTYSWLCVLCCLAVGHVMFVGYRTQQCDLNPDLLRVLEDGYVSKCSNVWHGEDVIQGFCFSDLIHKSISVPQQHYL